jgi:hypothetical protein
VDWCAHGSNSEELERLREATARGTPFGSSDTPLTLL